MTLKPIDKNTLKPIEEKAAKLVETVREKLPTEAQAAKLVETVKEKLPIKKKKSFRKEHPFLFALASIGQLILFLLPMAAWVILTTFVYPVPNSALLLVGGAGALLTGAGILALTTRGFGRRFAGFFAVPVLCLGAAVTALIALILYSPEVYRQFDEDMISRYVINLIAIIFLCISYGLFRGGVQNFLRNKGLSKSRIKKLKKGGLRCYWWYTDVQEETKMGIAYPLNIVFTVVFFLSVLINIFFGWMREFIPVTGGLMVVSCALAVLMTLFVLIKGRSNKRFITWLGDFLWLLFTAGLTYVEIMMLLLDRIPLA